MPDKDLKESARAGGGGHCLLRTGAGRRSGFWMVQEHEDQPITGSERQRRCLILYQGSAGAGGGRAVEGKERGLWRQGNWSPIFQNPSEFQASVCEIDV